MLETKAKFSKHKHSQREIPPKRKGWRSKEANKKNPANTQEGRHCYFLSLLLHLLCLHPALAFGHCAFLFSFFFLLAACLSFFDCFCFCQSSISTFLLFSLWANFIRAHMGVCCYCCWLGWPFSLSRLCFVIGKTKKKNKQVQHSCPVMQADAHRSKKDWRKGKEKERPAAMRWNTCI